MMDKIEQKFLTVTAYAYGALVKSVNKEIDKHNKLGYRLQHFEIKNMQEQEGCARAFLLFDRKETNDG